MAHQALSLPEAASGRAGVRPYRAPDGPAPLAATSPDLEAAAPALVLTIIASCTIGRYVLMLALGFGNDEAYSLAQARRWAWSYFDHPPLHLWIAHGAELLLGSGPLVRLPFVLLFAGTGWLLFRLTTRLFDPVAGLYAVVALNASAFFTLSPGTWVVPDGPLLFCLAAAALVASRILFPTPEDASSWSAWPQLGLWIGLAGLSKYIAVLSAAGLIVFILGSRRHRIWLCSPAPYCGAAIALAVLSPVLLWNAGNGWASLLFQSGRGAPSGGLHPLLVLSGLLGQLGILLPWIGVPLAAAMGRAGLRERFDSPAWLVLCLALPPIALFGILPLWGARCLPHWPMPGWFFGFPLLGAHLAGLDRSRVHRWAFGSGAALAILAMLLASHASTGWAKRIAPGLEAARDPTLEALDWRPWQAAFLSGPRGAEDGAAFLVAGTWIIGGKLDQAIEGKRPVLVFSDDPRGFAFAHDPSDFLGKDALIVVEAPYAEAEMRRLAPYFEHLDPPAELALGRSGMAETRLALIRAHRLVAAYALPYPRRRPPAGAASSAPHP